MGNSWYGSSAKRWFDLTSALLLLVISLPLCVLIAALIKLTSHGSAIFSQKRLGKQGKPFTLYKFRTMMPGAEKQQKKLRHLNEADGPVFKIRHDPRFTRFGKWLAHSGLDELPQLFNVVKGEMSLVGPRPLPVQEAKNIPTKWRLKREQVRPGIVSSWVIKGSQQLKFSRWMELDLKDQANSFRQDLQILWLSCFIILGKFQDLGNRFLRSLPHARRILARWGGQLVQHLLANPASYSLGLLYLITFSLFFLNGGEALSGQILFLAAPLLVLPLILMQKHSVSKYFGAISLLWLLYLAINIASTITSTSISLSVPILVKLLGIFVYWILFSLLFTHLSYQRRLKILANIIIGVGLLLALVGLYFLLPQTPKPLAGMNLFYAKYGHNHLASYLLVVLPLVLARWIKRSESVLYRNLSLFFLANLLLTFSRGAFVILPLITLVILLLYRPKRFQVLFLGVVAIVPLLLLLGIMLISHTNWAQDKRDEAELPWIERQLIKPVNAEGRLNYWQQAWRGWQKQPLLGNGPGTFRLVSLRFQKVPQTISSFAHSSVLEHLAEVGSLGMGAFLLLTLTPLIFLWKRESGNGWREWNPPTGGRQRASMSTGGKETRDRTHAFPLLLGTTALWLHSLIDFDFNFTALSLLFWVNLAALMATSKTGKEDKESLPHLTLFGITAVSIVLFLFVSFSIAGKIILLQAEAQKNQNPALAQSLYEKALIVFPFDQRQWLIVLTGMDDLRLQTSDALLTQALFFNQDDPVIGTRVAQHYQAIGNQDQALALYKKAAYRYPWQNYSPYLTFLYRRGKFETFGEELHQLNLLALPETLAPQIDAIDFNSPALRRVYQQLFKDNPELPDNYYKLYYWLGLQLIETEPELAEQLWRLSRDIYPDFGHLHVELASLLFHKLGSPDAASQVLQDCQSYHSPRQECLEQAYYSLPEPGSFRTFIY